MVILGRDKATLFGVLSNGNGHVFSATLDGKVSILHDFDLTRGAKPYDIMQASDDALYGTTYNGGDTGGGVLYRLGSSGSGFRVMSSFRIGPWIAGLNPIAGPVEGKKPGGGSDGFLYGATRYGGRKGRGTLYKIPLDGDSLGLTVLQISTAATGGPRSERRCSIPTATSMVSPTSAGPTSGAPSTGSAIPNAPTGRPARSG